MKELEGLWNLIMNKDESFTDDDWDKYKDIMITTNALQKSENDPTRPKSSRSDKWKTVLGPIWEEIHPKKSKTGSGLRGVNPVRAGFPNRVRPIGASHVGSALHKITNVIYLPSDHNALFDRLDLLLASKHAGNTGLRNELVPICDELKRLGQLTDIEYKDLNVLINND